MEQKEKDNKRFITPGGAGLAAICFFLPWVRACGQDVSGIQIANNGESVFWLVLIAAIVIVGGFFMFDGQNNLKKLKPIAIGGAVLSLLILFIKYSQFKNKGGIFEIQYGSIGTLLGFAASLFGIQFLEDTTDSDRLTKTGNTSAGPDIFCGECGAKLNPDISFCPECGKSIK
jgi:hypothetical protein